jgi:hypothetical protein
MTRTNPPSPKAAARQGPPSPAHAHDDHLYDDEFLHNEDVAHEHTDVNVRQLLLWTGILTATCVVSAVIVWGLFGVFEDMAASKDAQVSPLAVPRGQEPPQPRLLTNEPVVLQKLRKTEAATLEQYGWVDQKSGVARIPIAEAKKKLLHGGLAVRGGVPVDPSLGTRSATRGESSSGRAIPRHRPPSNSQLPTGMKKDETGTKIEGTKKHQ